MIKKIILLITLLIFTFLVSFMLYAQNENTENEDVIYKKKTVINFDDDTIQGELTTPDGEYIGAKKKVRHKSLIKLRDNFRKEILQSVKDL